ncbi:hypothetical protein [Ancylobacter rudongensis]|uniref:Ribonucleoside-diphosphate reductase alpha chain n=1 Tax=Ancylobacter rudongensis TaxID=177413 RepID=A0A1G4UQP3_9HYPH|nr:hypothetical protein [Ancylobacter rudongensis]SCW95867.1 ribonucleoside-diphosphate reductase alpha chain [Ancylobacter rudongensis]
MHDRPDYAYLNGVALKTLSRGYLREGILDSELKTEAIKRLDVMISAAEKTLGRELPWVRTGVKRGWVSPSSPVWSNYAAGRGLPISCNGSFIADKRSAILMKVAEIGEMSGRGAGTSAYMGALRPFGAPISSGGRSEGPVHFARLIQEQVQVISQSNVRRGNCAIYLDIEHADIDRWMEMRKIAGGEHHVIQHLSFGVCIGRQWWAEMKAEAKGGPKRSLMARIRNKRRESGYPYILFTDNANDVRPQVLKDKGLKIHASNLCTEIMNHSTPDESFVCNLSSVNLLWWHEWKNTPFIREMIYFLDAVLTEYIEKIEALRDEDPEGFLLMEAAYNFARRWRSVGLGVLGYHSLFQSKMIAFESQAARDLNIEIHRFIRQESHAASRAMAKEYGEPEGLVGTGYRHINLNAIAPTTSSSIICGQVSQSIEPWDANIFENDNAKGVFTQRNVHLEELLEKKGHNTTEAWTSILQAGGSVQHLDFLSDHEKAVFKTFVEIDQKEIIIQAADRQRFIDQGQSLNIKLPPEATMKEDMDLLFLAEELGLKSLYYRKGLNKAQELARANASCLACEA